MLPKINTLSFIFTIVLTGFLLSACGGVGGEDRSQFDGDTPDSPTTPPSTDTPVTQEFQLQVSVSGTVDTVQFTWMRQAINEAPGFNGTFTATGEEFEEPIVPESNAFSCSVSLTRETQTLYLYQIQCNSSDSTPTDPNPTQTTITAVGTLAYPVQLRINQQQRTLQSGVLTVEEVDESPEIVGLEGPQTCELSGNTPSFTLSCSPFTAAFGGINSDEQQLYLTYSDRDIPLTNWDESEMGQVIGGYFWVDSMLWLHTSTDSVYSISFANGSATEPVLRATNVLAMASLDERILIMQQPDNNQQTFVRYQDGALSQSTPYPNHTAVPLADNASPFRVTPRRISWLVRENGTEQFKLASFINVFTDLKTLPASLNKGSGLPVFNHDDTNIVVGFDESTAKFGLADSTDTEVDIADIDDFTSATIWHNPAGNAFLFHTRENAIVQQFTRTIEGETTSTGFNMAQLEQKIVDWVAGDAELLLAGERIDEGNDNDQSYDTLGKLTYLRSGSNELTETQIKNLLNVTTDLRVKLSAQTDPLLAPLVTVNTQNQHVLVYTGNDTTGTIWLLAGDRAFTVKSNTTIANFINFSMIVSATPYQAVIQDTEERIIVVVKN